MGVTGVQGLKCGSEIPSTNVFCKACLGKMESHPVRVDAVVQIPVRPAITAEKPSRKKKSYADYVRTLRRLIKALCVVVAILTLLVCLMGAMLYHMTQSTGKLPDIGKNYSTEQTAP